MNRELTNVQAEYAVRYLRKLAGIKNSQQIRSMVREMAKQACQR
jgi:hypothetical protein